MKQEFFPTAVQKGLDASADGSTSSPWQTSQPALSLSKGHSGEEWENAAAGRFGRLPTHASEVYDPQGGGLGCHPRVHSAVGRGMALAVGFNSLLFIADCSKRPGCKAPTFWGERRTGMYAAATKN